MDNIPWRGIVRFGEGPKHVSGLEVITEQELAAAMGDRNFSIDGLSGLRKTSVEALRHVRERAVHDRYPTFTALFGDMLQYRILEYKDGTIEIMFWGEPASEMAVSGTIHLTEKKPSISPPYSSKD